MSLIHHCRFFLILLFLFSSARAQAGRELTPIEKLSATQKSFLQPALEASFSYRLNPGVNCTGTYISNSGHFITALHCISACLSRIGALERERALPGRLSLRPVYKVSVDELRLRDNPTCKGKIGDDEVEVTVLATGGKGWLEPKNALASFSKFNPDEYKDLVDDGYEHSADYAILQIQTLTPKICLPLTETEIVEGQKLHAISYSCLQRKELRTSGQIPLFTEGIKTKGFKDSAYYKKLGEKRIQFYVEGIERKETFFSTLDIEKCGSGSALFDERLNIVGIATRVYKSSTEYEFGSLESISSAHILKELKLKRPTDFQKITSCTPVPSATSLANR